MRTNISKQWRRNLPLAVAAAFAVLVGQVHQWATADEPEREDRIVEITPNSDGVNVEAEESDARAAEPTYWLGIQGGPIDSPLLRTHLQLAEDLGVVVVDVIPDSPAEKAGLRKHDIVIAVDDEPVSEMAVLQKAVAERGAKPLELKVIRLAKEEKIEVTPEERPADLAARFETEGRGGEFGLQNRDAMAQLLEQPMRMFGDGMVMKTRPFDFNFNAMPGGMSISVAREGDGPATVTIKKGDKTWTVKGDDQAAIKKLPDDVRPIVERMLQGGQALQGGQPFVPNFQRRLLQEQALPGQLGGIEGMNEDLDAAHQRVMKQMQELEKRMEQFQRQLNEQLPAEKTEKEVEIDPSQT